MPEGPKVRKHALVIVPIPEENCWKFALARAMPNSVCWMLSSLDVVTAVEEMKGTPLESAVGLLTHLRCARKR
jgi:hypothetical protein